MKQTNKKIQSYLNFGVLLLIVIVVNVLGSLYYARIDLTKEKRYTLSATSKTLAKSLKDKIYFKLYLDGEMSARFKRLKLEIRDLAFEFREASGKKIEIQIIDVLKDLKGEQEVNEMLEQFAVKGIEPVRDIDNENPDETHIKYLLPGAELLYKERSAVVNFFEYDVALSPDENISRAIDNIEYEMANAIRQVSQDKKKRIAVADGNGEMVMADVNSFAAELQKQYDLELLNLNFADTNAVIPFQESIRQNPEKAEEIFIKGLHRRLENSDLLLVIKPLYDYSDQELYLIDQFIMKGGKVMWLIDPCHIEIDSFRNSSQNLVVSYDLERITSALFNYGVGIKNTLLMDLKCNRIPMPVSRRLELVDFPFFPLFGESQFSHIITKNMGTVWCQFPGTLEPKDRKDVKFTPLLVSTPYSKVINTPATIDLQSVYMQMRDENYRNTMSQGEQFSGLLLEGQFKSRYQFMKKYPELKHQDMGKSKMIVIADGDVIRNPTGSRGRPFPTGYDKISKFTFSNKKFLLNCIDYLIDDNGLIEIRAKERKLRLLDPEKAKSDKSFWQWYSIILPLITLIIFGVINYFIRIKRYT